MWQLRDPSHGSCFLWLCLTTTSFNPWQSSGHCTFPNCHLVYKQLLWLLGIASLWNPFSLFSFTPYVSLAVLYASGYLHQFGEISKCWRVSNWFKEALEPSQAAVFISFLLLCFILFFYNFIFMFSSIHALEIFLSIPWIDVFLLPLKASFPSFKPSGYFPAHLLTCPLFFKSCVSRSILGTQLTPWTCFSYSAVSRSDSGNIIYCFLTLCQE